MGRTETEGQTPTWWNSALQMKDELSLKDIAERVGVEPTTLAAEFARRGVRRRIRVESHAAHDLPPEPDEPLPPEPEDDLNPARRSGSKDGRIEKHFHLLGKVPDSEVARMADVSIRTVASYRARNDIPGYDGPRRRPAPRGRRLSKVDDFGPLLGRVPDRVVADIAGMSLGAVRNFRIKKGLPAAGRITRREIDKLVQTWQRAQGGAAEEPAKLAPRPSAPPAAQHVKGERRAWRVLVQGEQEPFVVLSSDLLDAVRQAIAIVGDDTSIASVDALGRVL